MSQRTNANTASYFYRWQSPQFYRTYYRRFLLFANLLTLVALILVIAATYKFYKLYLEAERAHYVFTSQGELVGLFAHFDRESAATRTGAQ